MIDRQDEGGSSTKSLGPNGGSPASEPSFYDLHNDRRVTIVAETLTNLIYLAWDRAKSAEDRASYLQLAEMEVASMTASLKAVAAEDGDVASDEAFDVVVLGFADQGVDAG